MISLIIQNNFIKGDYAYDKERFLIIHYSAIL